MSKKKDIKNREDIHQLVLLFYAKVRKDEQLSHFFEKVVTIDWDNHLDIMCNFWENVLFFSGKYDGNPMQVHKSLHTKSKLNIQHFQRWNFLFNETVDELFAGALAETIKQRASSISTVMQIKIFS